MGEQWRAVVGQEGQYAVSDYGRVRSLDRVVMRKTGPMAVRGRMLKTPIGLRGYRVVNIHGTPWTIHSLLTAAFIGPRPPGMYVRHLNGDKLDNRLVNLRYGTPSENAQDTVRHGGNVCANKTQCPQGHEYTPENTFVSTRGDGSAFRLCKICNYASSARRRAALKRSRRAA